MWPFKTSIEQLTEADLQSLVPDVRENYRLDYKGQIDNHDDNSTKEMLKDIISLANASGGYLIVGISEHKNNGGPDGLPRSVDGVADGDKEQKWIEQIAYACIRPPIIGLRVRDIPLTATPEKSCVIVFVPNSMNKPHMYERKGKRDFYQRHERQNLRMSIEQIREGVLSSHRATEEYESYIERQGKSAVQFANGKLSVWFYTAPLFVKTEKVDITDEAIDRFVSSPPRIVGLDLPSPLGQPLPLMDGLEATDATCENLSRLRLLNTGYIDFVECVFSDEHDNSFNQHVFEQYAYWWSKFSSVFMKDYLAGEILLFGIQVLNAAQTQMGIQDPLGRRQGKTPRTIQDSTIKIPELRIASDSDWRTAAMKMSRKLRCAYGYWNNRNFDESGRLATQYPGKFYAWDP